MNSVLLKEFVQFFTLTDAAATERISERLRLGLRDPAAYQEQFAEELGERGIVAELPPQELRDIALIDALLAEDLAWESDWKDTAADMAEGLNEILSCQNRPHPLRPSALGRGRGEPGPEQLDTVQDALEAQGLALVLFTLDSDSYPLSIVADEQAENLRQSARELGFGVTVY
ncbi:hypothetical protein IC235_01380 [Hymenobacter sp. BT664]|uniref:DUF6630 domain-containing protein n=1 Tax=Hymenobacter montanus TaxID=2771359 RepID=A0A927GHP6_9BACT|nr:hypothetical protein [Hymenobacter montanus]MBD2766540.1 hypothetical protein [Hymenobacter montanus]